MHLSPTGPKSLERNFRLNWWTIFFRFSSDEIYFSKIKKLHQIKNVDRIFCFVEFRQKNFWSGKDRRQTNFFSGVCHRRLILNDWLFQHARAGWPSSWRPLEVLVTPDLFRHWKWWKSGWLDFNSFIPSYQFWSWMLLYRITIEV